MPVTLKTGVMKYRKSDGTYSVMDALMSEQTQDQIAAIETAGQEQVDAIGQEGQNILDSLPEDYTELETDVGELKSAIDSIESIDNMRFSFIQGSAKKSGDYVVTEGSTIRCYVDITDKNIKKIYAETGYRFTVYWYTLTNDNKRLYVGSLSNFTSYADVSEYSDAYGLVVVAEKNDRAAFTPTEANAKITYTNPYVEWQTNVNTTLAEQAEDLDESYNIIPRRTNVVLENGIPDYSANSKAVCNSNGVPCAQGDTVEFVPVRPNIAGYHYEYVYKVYDSLGTVVEIQGNSKSYHNIVKIHSIQAASIKFGVVEKMGNTDGTLRKDTYGYVPYILVHKKEELAGELDTLQDVHNNLLSQARYSATPGAKFLTLLHFSDIHTDIRAMYTALDVLKKYRNKIDDAIHTGDISNTNWNDGLQNWIDSGCAPVVLNVLGNHESYVNSSFGAADKITVYTSILAPYVLGWNVVQPTGIDDSTSPYYCVSYYYKDYTDQKIRLIVLDTDYWDEYEQTWLTSVLADAKENSYHVILACHSPRYITGITEANFTSYTAPNINNYQNNVSNFPEGWLDPVDDFIEAGGNLICMLCGHSHRDHIGYLRDYPDILCITADTPSSFVAQDTARIPNEYNEHAYNAVTFNVTDKLITIVRFYADVDGHMRPKHVFCYDYGNKQIVSQW